MKRLALLILLTLPLRAADVEVGIHHVATMMTRDGTYDGAELEVEPSRGFAVSAEVFFSARVSTQLSATFVNPVAVINPGDVDLNTISLDIYAVTGRWHFAPQARLSGFAGAGAAFVSLGNLEERFDDRIELEFDPEATYLVEAGLRYRFRPRIIFTGSLMYMPLEAESIVIRDERPDVALPERVSLDPVTLSIGAAWRF
ncbi:MAG TPA: OmpW family outer membrane protein [Thermoanaerobaculia bacterium]|nr:OmpW family outer membrane protein [Thermoanaerobaculia bacterium]